MHFPVHRIPILSPSRSLARSRRGTALILALALMFTLFSFIAFGVDAGFLAQSRAELQRTADAAAMAGCWELYDGLATGGNMDSSAPAVRLAAASMAAMNPVCRSGPTLDPTATSQDIEMGFLSDTRNAVLSVDSSQPFMGVRATVSRTGSKNGDVPYFFGRIFGLQGRPMVTSATAVMARQLSGFTLAPQSTETLDLLPFALDLETWESLLSGATSDAYHYDPATGQVSTGSDGIREVNLYPQGTGSPGNRGTVDIGSANNSTNDIARQIVHGISAQDLQDLNKPLLLSSGSTMTLNGDTGISAGVKDELTSIIGQTRIIPIFSSVSGNGNNATYTIVRWCGVRILDVKLTGKMSGKQLIVQPAPMIVRNGVFSSTASSTSDFVLSAVSLAR